MKVEILYMAWNRLAFTKATLDLLRVNTDWERVSRLVIYDDGSTDGTREYLEAAGEDIPVPAYEIRDGGWRSVGGTMNDYVALTEADYFVKIDNDIAMPPGWLERLLAARDRNEDYELIGMEAGWTGPYQGLVDPEEYAVLPARHIGGVGLMRTKAFEWRRAVPLSLGKEGRNGFTIWQHRFHLHAGWLTPDLPNVQLDRIPDEPWASLARHYFASGWARAWEPFTPDMKGWWKWLPRDTVNAAKRASRQLNATHSPT